MHSSLIYRLFIGLLLLCAIVGCQQRTASKLLGRWEGRPDSAAKRAEREAEKYPQDLARPDGEGSSTKTDDKPQITDWEKYDVTIVMDFVSNDQVELSLEGEQTQTGTWKMVSTTPAGCTIEVQTEGASDAAKEKSIVRRRFDLLLDERDGTCVGFQLTETGADAQLGALYFSRPKSSIRSESN